MSPTSLSGRADRLTPDEIASRQVDVDALLAAAPAASDVVTTSPSATPLAFSIAEADDGGQGWTWLGMLLMVLGLVSVLSGSQTIRWAVLLPQLRSSFARQTLLLVKARPRGQVRRSGRWA